MSLKHDIFLAKEWFLAHRALGLWPDWREFKRIRTIYKGPDRHYHTWQHIYETCLFVRRHYGFQPLVILALIYHDVIYNVKSKLNEEESAIVWETYAMTRSLHRHKSLKVKEVAELIRMTAKHKVEENATLSFRIMSDADMSIFLCPDEHYLEYARNIWREYHSFGRDAYLTGRLHFLSTVDPDTMFYTHQAKALVHHARANLDLERTILETDPERILVTI
jgi:predicted metal-dependent HD superfamily phosphohydrolase